MNNDDLEVGDDSVVYGDVKGKIGRRCVIVGPTDNQGNTRIDAPMALGYGAHAGPNGIAIGTYAGARYDFSCLDQIGKIIHSSGDADLIEAHKNLISELRSVNKNEQKIWGLWNIIEKAPALVASVELIHQAILLIQSIPH